MMIYNIKQGGKKWLVMAIVNSNYTTKKKYTGISLESKDQWDSKKRRVKNHPKANDHNSKLILWEKRWNDYLEQCSISSRVPNASEGLELLDKENSRLYGRRLVSDAIMYYLDKNKSRLSDGTKRKYTAVLDDILRFNDKATVNDVGGDFYSRFAEFLLSQKNVNSTINRKITVIRTCVGAVAKEGWVNSMKHLQEFDLDEVKANRFPLTKDERVAIMNYRSHNMVYEMVAKAFVFSCYTGLRFSEIAKLHSSNIITMMVQGESVKVIKNFQPKVKRESLIPIPAHLEQYLREGSIFPLPTNITSNNILKSIAKEIGLDRQLECREASGSTVTTEIKPLCDIISFHFGRYTYADMLDRSGMNTFMMRDAMGHSSVGTTEGYRKEDDRLRVLETFRRVGI